MENEMVVSFPGGKRVDAHYNGFHIETDQSPKYGGEGTAPEPYDLFLASMATCAGIYVLSFCERRGLPTEGLRLVQRWFRDGTGRLERIVLDVELPEGFPEKYHKAVVRAAHQCTVKKTLDDPPELEVRVNGAASGSTAADSRVMLPTLGG